MSKTTFLAEIAETYTAHVLVKADDMDDAHETAEMLVNDNVIDPVKRVFESGDYSRKCEVIKLIKNGDALPEGVELFE